MRLRSGARRAAILFAFSVSLVSPTWAQTVIDSNGTPVTGNVEVGTGEVLVIDFANNQTLNITGDVLNSGTIFAGSSNPLITSGTINSSNVFNFAPGIVNSVNAPVGFTPLTNLTFVSTGTFKNEGLVTAQNLAVTAHTIVNGPFTGATGTNPVMEAMSAMTLNATSFMMNQGNLTAQSAAISAANLTNLNVMQATADMNLIGTILNINNTNGLISGTNIINFAGTGGSTLETLNLTGGDLSSQSIVFDNIRNATLDVNSIIGTLSGSADNLKVVSQTQDLTLGALVAGQNLDIQSKSGNVFIADSFSFADKAPGNLNISAALNLETIASNLQLSSGSLSSAKLRAGNSAAGGDAILNDLNIGLSAGSTLEITATGGTSSAGTISIGDVIFDSARGASPSSMLFRSSGDIVTGSLSVEGATGTAGGNITFIAPGANVLVKGDITILGNDADEGKIMVDVANFDLTGTVITDSRRPDHVFNIPVVTPGGGTGTTVLETLEGGNLVNNQVSLSNVTSNFQQTLSATLGLNTLGGQVSLVSNGQTNTNTNLAGVNVSSPVINAKEGKVSRLVLPGQKKEAGTGNKVDDIIDLHEGERLTFSSSDLSEEELIPEDGTDGSLIAGKVTTADKGSSDVVHNLYGDGFIPIEIIRKSSAAPVTNQSAPKFKNGFLAKEGTDFTFNDVFATLKEGSILVHSGNGHRILRSGGAEIRVSRGAIAHVDSVGGVLRVKSLSGPGHVMAVVKGRRIPVHVGQELLVTNHRPTLSEVFPTDGVGRRQLLAVGLTDKDTAIISDFSMVALLGKQGHLHALRSPGTGYERSLHNKILKTAAALDIATRNHGPFFMANKNTASRIPPKWVFKPDLKTSQLIALLKN